MNERGTLWIIPDENQIMQPIYMKKVGEVKIKNSIYERKSEENVSIKR